MKLYNTLSRKIEDFKPRQGNKVNFFVCGPTVYDDAHLGHAKTYIQMDILARVLRHLNYEVFYLQNITDLDDKIIERAKEKQLSWEALRSEYQKRYYEDMKLLRNNSVTKYARATDYIKDIISQVQTLLDKQHAYVIADGVYFEVSTFPQYGKLSGRTEVKEQDAQSRIDHSDEKRGWNDFCLWKFSKPGEPVWEAPFGKGRPGWHIEDTAITEHYFGPQYDIHGGAVDLIFPHHEAEITQMEAASDKVPFVKYWTHVGFLNIDSVKMSKSLGNFFTVRDVIKKGYNPMAVRLLMLQAHYRSPINFSWQSLEAAQNNLYSLYQWADLQFQDYDSEHLQANYKEALKTLQSELENDLNTPAALAVLNGMINRVEELGADKAAITQAISVVEDLFGLGLDKRQDITKDQKELIGQREKARKAKDWTLSDELRAKLASESIQIRDTEQGPVWSRIYS